jgi:hypothetical protein
MAGRNQVQIFAMSTLDQKDNDVPAGSNIRFDASELKGRALLVLYVIAVVVAMTGWIWFLGTIGMHVVAWLAS